MPLIAAINVLMLCFQLNVMLPLKNYFKGNKIILKGWLNATNNLTYYSLTQSCD